MRIANIECKKAVRDCFDLIVKVFNESSKITWEGGGGGGGYRMTIKNVQEWSKLRSKLIVCE